MFASEIVYPSRSVLKQVYHSQISDVFEVEICELECPKEFGINKQYRFCLLTNSKLWNIHAVEQLFKDTKRVSESGLGKIDWSLCFRSKSEIMEMIEGIVTLLEKIEWVKKVITKDISRGKNVEHLQARIDELNQKLIRFNYPV